MKTALNKAFTGVCRAQVRQNLWINLWNLWITLQKNIQLFRIIKILNETNYAKKLILSKGK